jgi:hypothetical protein
MFTHFKLRYQRACLVSIGVFAATISFLSCGPSELRPARKPSGVPVDAVWAGGADGGAYIRCSIDLDRDVDRCTIWNDYTGQTAGPHDYRLQKEHRAARASELKFLGAGGESIFLQNGLILSLQ